MDIRFDGKRALVTGAGQGIGRDIAKALASGGADVYALDKSQESLDTLQKEVPSIKGICVDLLDWVDTRKTVEALRPIHLLVNNAGVAMLEPVLEVSPAAYDMTMNVNVKGALNVTQVVAAGMVENGQGGAIVNISSQGSIIALKDHLSYCASKAALDQMTRVMALELGPHQIRVNTVNPTVAMTDMGRMAWSDPAKAEPMLKRIPMGRFAEVKDIVHPVLFLLSDKADMINGVTLPVDGGVTAC